MDQNSDIATKISHSFNNLNQLSPQMTYEHFCDSYTKKDNLLKTYIQMKSKTKEDYFPQTNINDETLQIILKQSIFSARVIHLADKWKIKDKKQLQKIFTKQNKTYTQYLKLKKYRGQYAARYLADIGFLNSNKSSFNFSQQVSFKNYLFYSGEKIQKLQNLKGDYCTLQDRHDYIQWMFPNHFQSMFNSHSWPMSYLQINNFKTSSKLGNLLLQSIQIFFDFLGLKINTNLQIQIIEQKRLKQALLVNWHNHLRLRRMIACLSITGFRLIALKFIDFLKDLVYNNKQYSRIKNVYERQWKIYGNSDIKKAIQICFHTSDQFPQPHKVLKQKYNIEKFQQQLKIIPKKSQMRLQNFDDEPIAPRQVQNHKTDIIQQKLNQINSEQSKQDNLVQQGNIDKIQQQKNVKIGSNQQKNQILQDQESEMIQQNSQKTLKKQSNQQPQNQNQNDIGMNHQNVVENKQNDEQKIPQQAQNNISNMIQQELDNKNVSQSSPPSLEQQKNLNKIVQQKQQKSVQIGNNQLKAQISQFQDSQMIEQNIQAAFTKQSNQQLQNQNQNDSNMEHQNIIQIKEFLFLDNAKLPSNHDKI